MLTCGSLGLAQLHIFDDPTSRSKKMDKLLVDVLWQTAEVRTASVLVILIKKRSTVGSSTVDIPSSLGIIRADDEVALTSNSLCNHVKKSSSKHSS